MKPRARTSLLVLLLFAALTLIHLLPLSVRPVNAVHDAGDPLLNSWILSRVDDQLLRDPLRLFQANIFYPHRDTLALSEHMLPLAAAAAPVYFATGNAVLGHNVVLWLAFILNGFGMFLLVRHLTGRVAAGIMSGIIFAFCTYRFMHVSHIQLLASFWVPLCFLYLHKFLTERTWRASILFSLFFVLQALSCMYYGLFTVAVLSLVLPLFLLLNEKKLDWTFIARLAVPLAVAGVVLYVFSLPYTRIFERLGLKRELMPGAELQNYLSVVPDNFLFGKLLHKLGTHEKFLFPGIIACLFAVAAVIVTLKWAPAPTAPRKHRLPALVLKVALSIFAALAAVSLIAALFGGLNIPLGFLKISMTSAEKPALYLFLLGAGYLLYHLALLARVKASDNRRWVMGYAVLTVWAMALSFGGGFTLLGKTTKLIPMPFAFFYRFVPGFDGIREPVRFAVFVIFGIAVLAGFGVARWVCRFRKGLAKAVLIGLLLAGLNLEYLSIPVGTAAIPVGKDVPETYRWLKEQSRDAVVLELPFSEWLPGESAYLYFATYHKKKLVNGYSGFIPASTYFLRDQFREFPGRDGVSLLRALGVNYVIVHAKGLPAGKSPDFASRVEAESGGSLKLERRFQYGFSRKNEFEEWLGDDYVFLVAPAGPLPAVKNEPAEWPALPREKWRVTASSNSGNAGAIKDGDLATAWNSERPKAPGDYLAVDLGEVRTVRKIALLAGRSYYGYGLEFRVEASDDGQSWRPVAAEYSKADFLRALVKDQVHAAQDIRLEECRSRFVRVVQTGQGGDYSWSVAEIKIYE
jgi:hypothetical protein